MPEVWRPGSFTKNFSWGPRSGGLVRLHDNIRLGFDGAMEDVPRGTYRNRVEAANRPDFIPLNFFLFNKIVDGVDYVVADELVFQALNYPHSARFDKLALFALNFSYAGRWKGAAPYQRRPALWAFHYVKDRLAGAGWIPEVISAKDIEDFVSRSPAYHAKGAGKLSTNLNYLYNIGRLAEMSTQRVERWWVDALFLALDRLIEDRRLDGRDLLPDRFQAAIAQSGFAALSGPHSLEKDLALRHLIRLYTECGARERFSEERVRERTQSRVGDVEGYIPNDDRPQGAVHSTNPKILKSIPRACAMLAKYAGFDVLDADELDGFDVEAFIAERMRLALNDIQENKIKPTMSAEELMKLTRGK